MKPRIEDIVREINSKLGFLGWSLLKYKPKRKQKGKNNEKNN
jgi:hypothetical protein